MLREAVRLLEYHSVAWMRRGPGGGLVVTSPDAAASVDAVAIYLDYQHVGTGEFRAVREVLEIGCLEAVTARHDDPEVATRLVASIHDHSPGVLLTERGHDFHTELAELTGNPVLALFLRVLTTVGRRRTVDAPADAQEVLGIGERVDAIHQKIMDAIIAGDAPLATHRMRRHLDAITAWWQ